MHFSCFHEIFSSESKFLIFPHCVRQELEHASSIKNVVYLRIKRVRNSQRKSLMFWEKNHFINGVILLFQCQLALIASGARTLVLPLF